VSETLSYGAFALTYRYDYYRNGSKKSITYPGGQAYTYSYEPNNGLNGIQVHDQGSITVTDSPGRHFSRSAVD